MAHALSLSYTPAIDTVLSLVSVVLRLDSQKLKRYEGYSVWSSAFLSSATPSDERTASSDVSVDFVDGATWLRLNWGF